MFVPAALAAAKAICAPLGQTYIPVFYTLLLTAGLQENCRSAIVCKFQIRVNSDCVCVKLDERKIQW